ncbi:MAG: thiamine-phosphate kinase [Acidobacteria bacterium]|nr:thiamine-phosphate kinase [Acidobacteriota bacterium]
MKSEFELINRIRDQVAGRIDLDLVLGIGDDAAILREQTGRETLVTVDFLVEEIDFKLEYTPPRWLGHKALATSLSDIAAMGGRPRYSLLTLGISRTGLKSDKFWGEVFEGYFALAGKYGVILIGGDISSTPDRLAIDSIVIGHCRQGKAIRRSRAIVGDDVFVTGKIGASAIGLKMLEMGARVDEREEGLLQSALRAHLRPEPRVLFGTLIGELDLAHAMIDVSDGLAQDLRRICEESDVDAIIDRYLVPLADESILLTDDPETAFSFAMSGGEDFELVLTASRKSERKLMKLAEDCQVVLTRIGEITEKSKDSAKVLLRQNGQVKPILYGGFDHFINL